LRFAEVKLFFIAEPAFSAELYSRKKHIFYEKVYTAIVVGIVERQQPDLCHMHKNQSIILLSFWLLFLGIIGGEGHCVSKPICLKC
jgi:hypothetical protein